MSSQLTRDPCALPDDLLVGLWDREARDRIDAGFARSELGYAADAREEVSDELGRYIDAWTGERRALCEAAEDRDERFDDTREHLCLERLLHRAGRLSESFQRAEAATVTIAPELIAELPPPRTCAESPSTATTATTTADQAQVFALEDRISAARQLGAAGDEAGAIAQIDATIADAAALGDDTGHIRALLAKAKIGAAFPDPTPAIEAAHAAIGLATRLGEEGSVGEALTVLAKVHTDHAQYDKAEAVGELARRVLQETGASHQRIELAEVLGELAIARERWDDALAQLEPARAQAVELYGADHLVVADLDQELAWANGATQRDAAAADRYYEHALAVYIDHYGEHHPTVGILYNDIGVLAYQRNEYPRAEESFARALAIYRDAWGPRHPESLTTLANVANAASMRGDTERAITLGREVLRLRAEVLGTGSVEYAGSARDLGMWLRDAGRYDEALPLIVHHYETTAKVNGEGSPQTMAALARVVDFALVEGDVSTRARYGPKLRAGVTTVPEDHPRFEYLLGVMSLLTRHEGDAAASLEFGERRVAWLTERAGARSPDTALAVSNVGTALLALGRPQAARLRLREALAILEADRTVSPLDYEFLVLPLAQAELEIGERESARGRLLSLLDREEIPRRPRLHAELELLLAETTDDPEERRRRAEVALALIESGRAPRSLLVDVERLRSAGGPEPAGPPRVTASPESAVGSSAATVPSAG